MSWINTKAHNRWLETETDRIFEFGRKAFVPTGFGWIGNNGKVREEMGTQLWITARMIHVYAIAALMGRPGAAQLVEHGIDALNGPLKDKKHGGWYAKVDVNDGTVLDASKQGYQHFFVLLGAASAATTGSPKAKALLDEAIEVIEKFFWSQKEQMCLESWDEAFSKTEDYRGGNANMHAVEAFLIVYDVTKDKKWLDRAIRIASVIIHDVARNNHFRVNEHFDSNWTPLLDYNKESPASHFRAYGGTPGHWVEWGRLMLHLRATLLANKMETPDWLLEDAKNLFAAGVRDAWSVDGKPGFVYSVDWDGKPVVRERIRWVIVEAMGTAYALYEVTKEAKYEEYYQSFWDYCRTYLMDYETGSWWQELDTNNKVSNKVWDGKQDIYHLLHCLVIPRLPLTPGLAPALAAGLLDKNEH
ncbi:AGE family epimerase/isomerase [Orbus mooreae]|uniref:AGE family epimerase/isomerase n=1 Tax=Orbus mooreae TaxID=3074107 RepID=UPI00370D1BEA